MRRCRRRSVIAAAAVEPRADVHCRHRPPSASPPPPSRCCRRRRRRRCTATAAHTDSETHGMYHGRWAVDSSFGRRTVGLEVLVHRRKVLPTDLPWHGRPVGSTLSDSQSMRMQIEGEPASLSTCVCHRHTGQRTRLILARALPSRHTTHHARGRAPRSVGQSCAEAAHLIFADMDIALIELGPLRTPTCH